MRYNRQQLQEAQSGFQTNSIVFDTFLLEFENEKEFIEHFNFMFDNDYTEDHVDTYSLYQNGDNENDVCFSKDKKDFVVIEGTKYLYKRRIFGVEG